MPRNPLPAKALNERQACNHAHKPVEYSCAGGNCSLKQKPMSNWRTHIFALATTFGLFFVAQSTVVAAEKTEASDQGNSKTSIGGYTPCMVQPVFVKPNIAPAIITKDEIIKPTLIRSTPQKWHLELADIERPTFVEKVILKARYDGCSNLSEERKAAQKGVYYLPKTTAGNTRSGAGSIASRLLNAADQCCGHAVGR